MPNICHTLCRALGRRQCSKHYLSSRNLESSEQTHKLSRYYHTVRCMLWITKVNNTYWTLATCQALSCVLHMNDLFYPHPDPLRQALTFPSLCSWGNRSMETARSYCKRQNQTSNSGGVTPGTCSLNLSAMLLFCNITWRSVGGIHVWGIFGPRKAKKVNLDREKELLRREKGRNASKADWVAELCSIPWPGTMGWGKLNKQPAVIPHRAIGGWPL